MTKVTEGNKTVTAKVFTKALAIVKAAANEDTKLQVSLDTSACEAWNAEGVDIYCYAYYDAPTTTGKKTVEPFDIWPGKKMTKSGNVSSIDVPTTTGSAKLIFTAVTGELGTKHETYIECTQVGKIPNGYKKDENGNLIIKNPKPTRKNY